MAPQVIAADEIGTRDDVLAIKEAVCSRCKGNFHGSRGRKKRVDSKSSA